MAIPSVVFTWTIADPADKSRPAALEASGWTSIVNKPSRQHMNWMFENISQWITYFNDEAIPDAAVAYLPDFLVEHNSDGTHDSITAVSVTVDNGITVGGSAEIGGSVTVDGILSVAGYTSVDNTFSAVGNIIISADSDASSLTMEGDRATISGQFFKHFLMRSEFGIDLDAAYVDVTTGGWKIKFEEARLYHDSDDISGVKTSSYELSHLSDDIYDYVPPGTTIIVFNDNGYVGADFVLSPFPHYVSDVVKDLLCLRYDLSNLTQSILRDQTGANSSAIVFPFRLMAATTSATNSYDFQSNPHYSFFRGCEFDVKYVPGVVGNAAQVNFVSSEKLDGYPGSTNTTYLSVDATDNTLMYLTIPYSDLPFSAIDPGGYIQLIIKIDFGEQVATNSFYTLDGSDHSADPHMPNVWFFYPALLKNVMTENGIGSTDF